ALAATSPRADELLLARRPRRRLQPEDLGRLLDEARQVLPRLPCRGFRRCRGTILRRVPGPPRPTGADEEHDRSPDHVAPPRVSAPPVVHRTPYPSGSRSRAVPTALPGPDRGVASGSGRPHDVLDRGAAVERRG